MEDVVVGPEVPGLPGEGDNVGELLGHLGCSFDNGARYHLYYARSCRINRHRMLWCSAERNSKSSNFVSRKGYDEPQLFPEVIFVFAFWSFARSRVTPCKLEALWLLGSKLKVAVVGGLRRVLYQSQ